MAFSKNFRTPAQLTGVARAAFRAFCEQYMVSDLLPLATVRDINFTYGDVAAALPAAAVYRAYDSESDVGEIPGTSSKSGKLPPISQRHPVGEYQQLKLYGDTEGIGQAFEERAIRSAQAIAARVILAAYEAVQSGSVTISENGLNFAVNYGRTAGLTANASTVWSTTATADPITDLENLRAVYKRPIGRVVVSRQAMNYLQANTNIIKLVLGRGSDLVPRVSVADVQSVFSDYDLGQLIVNEETVTNKAGSVAPVIAADKVLILPAGGSVGSTKVGIPVEAIEEENGIPSAERAGLFSGALARHDSGGFNVLVSSIVLPVLDNPDATATLDAY